MALTKQINKKKNNYKDLYELTQSIIFAYIHFFIFQRQRRFVLIFKAAMEQKGEESCPNQDILLAEESPVLHKNQKMTHNYYFT